MLDYTKASLNLIMEDIRRIAKIYKFASLVFTTAYFVFVMFMQTGYFIANIVLASLFFSYTIFELLTAKQDIKKAKKIVKRTYHWIKHAIKLIIIAAMIYSIYSATTDVSTLTTIFTTIMIILWIFQVFIELVVQIFESKLDLVIAGWNQDIENIKRPLTNVSRFAKRIRGIAPEPVSEKSKEIVRLEKRIAIIEEDKKAKKLASRPKRVKRSRVKEIAVKDEKN